MYFPRKEDMPCGGAQAARRARCKEGGSDGGGLSLEAKIESTYVEGGDLCFVSMFLSSASKIREGGGGEN